LKTEILIKATFLKAFSAKILRKQTGAPGNRRGVSEKQNWVF
jgi:hypothetical protein